MSKLNKVKICECPSIASSIKNIRFLSGVFDDLANTTGGIAVVGEEPKHMPVPTVKPVEHIHNLAEVTVALAGLKPTWVRVQQDSAYGVYYHFIALFGDRHWVTQDRSGHCSVRIYEKPFT